MPLYEYKCLDCQKVHEVIQKFSDAPLDTCPLCQGALTKLMSMSSFSLKGSGWYTTDYKRAAAPSEAEAAPNAKDSTHTSPDGKVTDGKVTDGKATGEKANDGTAKEPKAKESSPESRVASENKVAAKPSPETKVGAKSATPPTPGVKATAAV